jgi:hypothetical protein
MAGAIVWKERGLAGILTQRELMMINIFVSYTMWEAEDELGWIADRQMIPSDINPLSDYIGDPARWQSVRAQILRSIINRLPQPDESVNKTEVAPTIQATQDTEPGNVEIVIALQNKRPFHIDALVVEKDRYQVLSGEQKELNEDGVDGSKIEKDAQEITPKQPGDCIVSGENPIRFNAIIHDLDQTPTWKEEWIAKALANIFHEISQRQISSIGLPVLGSVHGNLSTSKFAAIFNIALKEATIAHPLKVWIMAEDNSIVGLKEIMARNVSIYQSSRV